MPSLRSKAAPVKRKRRYEASRRKQAATQNRDRMVQAAERRFLAEGYGAATIAAIAGEAGVSVDSIYKAFGGKPGLVRAVYARALRGEGAESAERRSDSIQAGVRDGAKIIEAWGQFVTEIAPRAAPIFLLVRAAATAEPELNALLREIDAARLDRMAENAGRLHAAGHLRPGISVAHAAEVLWTYSSPELYDLLVMRRKMPLARYGHFVAEAMAAALL